MIWPSKLLEVEVISLLSRLQLVVLPLRKNRRSLQNLHLQHVPKRSVAYSRTTFLEMFAIRCLVDAYTVSSIVVIEL